MITAYPVFMLIFAATSVAIPSNNSLNPTTTYNWHVLDNVGFRSVEACEEEAKRMYAKADAKSGLMSHGPRAKYAMIDHICSKR